MKNLTIYKASAGSGKTFTLVVEYLCLLMRNPLAHDQILAVTFTNKATEEMKMRIISQLYGISRKLPDSDGYLRVISERTHMTESDIRSRCSTALHHILHHYNNFRIQTIDAFFQTVFRNMARELDLPPNLRIDLNDKQVEEKAVDELVSSLDDKSQVLSWIREYIASNMQEDKGWNVINELKRFGENIFKDFYKNHEESLHEVLGNPKLFALFRKQLVQQRDAAATRWHEQVCQLQNLLSQSGFDNPACFKFGSRGSVWSYIHKQPAVPDELSPTPANVRKFIDSPADNVKPDAGGEPLIAFAENELCPQLENFEKERQRIWHQLQSARLALRNINQLRLLYSIDTQVKRMNEEANRFQLSNTQSLLKSFIQNTDSPFIYEKIGAYLRHIMIDEFQDTSRMQWDNFKVLLQNNMSNADSSNLIVGDVKQSIYRWRGGDWQLLNNIDQEFGGVSSDSPDASPLRNVTLEWNHRSSERIVSFNNIFFEHAVQSTLDELTSDGVPDSQQLVSAYDGHKQKIRHDDGEGYVRIDLYNDDKEEYDESVLDGILNHIDTLMAHGARQSDIAILLRRNKHIELIADTIMQRRPDLDVVSGEAFRLDVSPAVNIIIDALTLLVNPDDDLMRHTLAKSYAKFVLKSHDDDNTLLLSSNVNRLLPQRFVEDTTLATMPLTDLTDTLYEIFSLQEIDGQGAYISKFNDVLSNYVYDNTSDIQAFLTAWTDSLHSEKIQADVVNGIRLLSIHKSKGLEFPHVIVPFCDWQIEQPNSMIWCEGISEEPFCMLPVIPVRGSRKSLSSTVFESSYMSEHLQNVVDNMNLLYVAFTRAGKSLYVLGKRRKPKKEGKSSDILSANNRSAVLQKVVPLIQPQLPGSILTDDEQMQSLEWGELTVTSHPSPLNSHPSPLTPNVFNVPEQSSEVTIQTFTSPVVFRQSNKSREYVQADDDSVSSHTDYIQLGNILHDLFAHIRTAADIEPRLRELQLEGVLYDDQLTPDVVRRKIKVAMQSPLAADWFSGRWQLFNERTILVADPSTGRLSEYRPDRVMHDGSHTIVVDFKFGAERSEHLHQVRHYMDILSQMGYTNVRGYLWYVMRDHITEV